MLEETDRARARLNEKRKKELKIDCKFYFSDKERDHIDCLRKVLNEKGYSIDDGRIELINRPFEGVLEKIIDAIRTLVSLALEERSCSSADACSQRISPIFNLFSIWD